MTAHRRFALSFLAPLAITGFALVAGAREDQPSTANAEKKLSGTVEAATQHECEICKCVELSVLLKTSAGRVEVRLGPKAFFEEHDLFFSRGDSITVTGIQFTERRKEIVLANEVWKGGEHLVLRGRNGKPAWMEAHRHPCPVCGN
jgi:hypothetical protein